MRSNRKLRSGIVFEGRCYMQYQMPFIKRYMHVHSCSDADALKWYESTGLAKLFEEHHRPHKGSDEIIVSELGQEL